VRESRTRSMGNCILADNGFYYYKLLTLIGLLGSPEGGPPSQGKASERDSIAFKGHLKVL